MNYPAVYVKKQPFFSWLFLYTLLNGLSLSVICLSYLKGLLKTDWFFQIEHPTVLQHLILSTFPYLSYFSYMMLLAVFTACILIPALLILKYQRLQAIISVITFILLNTLILIDLNIFSIYQTHLNATLLFTFFQIQLLHLSSVEKIWIGTLLIGMVLYQIGLYKLSKRLTSHFRPSTLLKFFALSLFGGFISFSIVIANIANGNIGFAAQTAVLPYYNQLFSFFTRQKEDGRKLNYFSRHRVSPNFITQKPPVNYPPKSLVCHPPNKRYNIILLSIDNLRFDSVNANEMPYLNKSLDRFTEFHNHWSSGNGTQAGMFGLFYGLPGNYWYSMIHYGIPPILTTQLKKQQYTFHTFWSSSLTYPPFSNNLYLGYDTVYAGSSVLPNAATTTLDKLTIQKTQNILNKERGPYFLHMHLDTVHAYCSDLNLPKVFKPVQTHCQRLVFRNHMHRLPYYNRYRNSVHFVDEQLQAIFRVLDRNDLWKKSIVIITSDHGEEFDDNRLSFWGHSSNYTQYQLRVPFLVHWPGKKKKIISYKTTHYDFPTTLLKTYLHCDVPRQSIGLGKDLYHHHHDTFSVASSYTDMAFLYQNRIMLLLGSGDILIQDEYGKTLLNETPKQAILKRGVELITRYYQ